MVTKPKGVMRFRKKGQRISRFIGPYEILEHIGEVAYQITLPASIERVHDVFHISHLTQYIKDDSHANSSTQTTGP